MPEDAAQTAPLRELCERVKRVIDYRSFYTRYCPGAHQSGQRLQALCPIPAHGHTGKGHPSLSIDLTRGLFHCFSRDEGGDAITFYQLMHGVAFARAVRELARELGIDRKARPRTLAQRAAPDPTDEAAPEPEPLPRARVITICEKFLQVCRREVQTEGINYLARRGIDAKTARRAGLAYFPRRAYRRVMRRMQLAFPLADLQRGGVPSLYNVDALADLPTGHTVYLVEGFTDTLTLTAHGFAAVGLVGAGGLKAEWLAPLARFRVVSALDPDAAGRRAAAAYEELFAARGRRLARITLPTDVNDFFRQHPAAAVEFQLLTESALEGTSDTKRKD
jgi:DNA primase